MFVVLIIAGVVLSVINANGWMCVPDWCIYGCFGVGALMFIVPLVMFHNITKKFWEE